ncbi:hypothetical protein CP960_06515 [Malaciobacter halophilus]|uniref:histidine kinase n=1 Tax=Malaciobacter halophilus TaxID=197482 RepID=A0A2N1J3B3_9BACT|nr:ATP-binding protein [Malaciobacter halophilus]AXH09645.1 signal transduction sensor histidine kinase [Malaciobacter halophilus]PKI80992.1 hypothetical protein CP960_06515 [Malaciobacter halophilus]
MSFKYRFILSFVFLEIFFILLIVSLNFTAINSSSQRLTNEKIETNIEFLKELLKIPLSIYDLATLDNLLQKTQKIDYINSIVVLDNQEKIVSSEYIYEKLSLKEFLLNKHSFSAKFDNETYEIRYQKIYEEDIFLGSFYIVFDTSSNTKFIKENKQKTIYIVLLEIFVSTFLAYFLGRNLTKALTKLSLVAKDIAKENRVKVPYLNKKDELGILANSMNSMQKELIKRRVELESYNNVLKEQKQKLIEANNSKDDFLANMSHELKTPLNSILLLSSLMMKNRKNNLEQVQIKNLNIINRCGNDLLYLINDILDLSKLESGNEKIQIAKFDMYENILEIKELFESQIKQKNLNFDFSYDKLIPKIISDKNKINQIIKNLLSNAVKFTNKGTISLNITNQSNQMVKISIVDEGIGIAKNKHETIFDRFKQADSSTTRRFGGTGLGLAICKELSILLNASIQLESSIEDKGSCFVLYIPYDINQIKSVPLKNVNETIYYEKKDEKIVENVENKEILVFNDNPLVLFSSITQLKKTNSIKNINDIEVLLKTLEKNSNLFAIINMKNLEQERFKTSILKLDNQIILIDSKLDYKKKNIICINESEVNKDLIIKKLSS